MVTRYICGAGDAKKLHVVQPAPSLTVKNVRYRIYRDSILAHWEIKAVG